MKGGKVRMKESEKLRDLCIPVRWEGFSVFKAPYWTWDPPALVIPSAKIPSVSFYPYCHCLSSGNHYSSWGIFLASSPVLIKVWFTDQHKHHLGAYCKCRFYGLHVGTLTETLEEWGSHDSSRTKHGLCCNPFLSSYPRDFPKKKASLCYAASQKFSWGPLYLKHSILNSLPTLFPYPGLSLWFCFFVVSCLNLCYSALIGLATQTKELYYSLLVLRLRPSWFP